MISLLALPVILDSSAWSGRLSPVITFYYLGVLYQQKPDRTAAGAVIFSWCYQRLVLAFNPTGGNLPPNELCS